MEEDAVPSVDEPIVLKQPEWMEIGMVSIIFRNRLDRNMVPKSKSVEEKYPDLAGLSLTPMCYFDIDRNGIHAHDAIVAGKSPARISFEYLKNAKYALKKFAKWLREHPESSFAQAKYLIGISRLGSEVIGARLGFDIFDDVEPAVLGGEEPSIIEHHSVEMAKDTYTAYGAKRGLPEEDAKKISMEKVSQRSVTIAIMPIDRLLSTY